MDWEIRHGDEVTGPFAESEVEARILGGALDPATLVRPHGRQAWKPATRHGRFAAAARRAAGLGSVPPPPSGEPVSRRAPDVPYKDPSRWDQQTQLNMVAPPAAWVAPPPPPPYAAPTPVVALRAAVAAPAVVSAPPRGLVAGLLDLSFTSLVTTRILRVLYGFFLVAVLGGTAAGVLLAATTIAAASAARAQLGVVIGCAQLVGTLIVAAGALLVGRMMFEGVVVFFRIAEHLGEIDRKTRG